MRKQRLWKWLMRPGDNKGEVSLGGILSALALITMCIVVLPLVFLTNTDSAINKLEGDGYIVLAAGEYTSIDTLLDAIKEHTDNLPADPADASVLAGLLAGISAKTGLIPAAPASETTASAAVIAAQNAVIAAALAAETSDNILDKLLLFNENEAYLWPDNVSVNVLLTAGTPSDNFCAWTEISDNVGTLFTPIFAANAGYLREVTLYEYSVGDQLCILEIGYGPDAATVTTVGRCFVRSDFTWVLQLSSARIPATSHVYYRFKSENPGETFRATFKYILVP